MRFKPEVEGLRGVAVAAVVLAHAKLAGFGGGFVGVDVFFVVSGYLITALLSRELSANGQVDYWRFYARRARRLLPAFVLMSAVTLVLALALLPAITLFLQGVSGSLASLWASNFYFAFKQFDYFAEGAGASLFLHTWSLGVEEQFYLLWPIFLATAWRWGVARNPARLATLLGAVTVLGYASALLVHRWHPVAAYYLMPTRLWELSLGGVIAVVPLAQREASPHRAGLRVVGLAMIVSGVLLVPADARDLFGWLLLPVLGTASMLLAGEDSGSRFRALDNPPLRFLGRISYSLYLWHWPLLGLARLLFADQPAARAAAVSIAAGLAWASTAWVEEPIRRSRTGVPRTQVLAGLLASMTLAFAFQHVLSSRMVSPDDSPEARILGQLSVPSLYQAGCDDWYRRSVVKPCVVVGNAAPALRFLLVGDSVGAQWTPALERISQRRGWSLTVVTKSSCPIVDIRIYYARIGREYTECEAWRNRVVDYIHHSKPDILIIGSSANTPLEPEQWVSGTRAFLDRTQGSVRRVLVLAPTPVLRSNPVDCLLQHNRHARRKIDSTACAMPLTEVARSDVIAALAQATQGRPAVRLVDFAATVCPRGTCLPWRDGWLVFRDEQHLNARFVAEHADEVDALLSPLILPAASPAGAPDRP